MATPDRIGLLFDDELEEVERPKVKRTKRRKMLKWPSVIGAVDVGGFIVVGSRASRSKHTKQSLLLYRPGSTDLYTCLPHDMDWADTHSNIALLGEALRELLNTKIDVPFDRGSVALRLVDNRLYLMECGYQDSLWPQYWWTLPHGMKHTGALSWAIQQETLSPDSLVAQVDTRTPAKLEHHVIE